MSSITASGVILASADGTDGSAIKYRNPFLPFGQRSSFEADGLACASALLHIDDGVPMLARALTYNLFLGFRSHAPGKRMGTFANADRALTVRMIRRGLAFRTRVIQNRIADFEKRAGIAVSAGP